MGCGGNMKGSRLVDVLDDTVLDTKFWNKIFAKMNTLLVAMETAKGNYNIDDPEIRWVQDSIEGWDTTDRILDKNEMLTANMYWKKFGGPHNVVKNG